MSCVKDGGILVLHYGLSPLGPFHSGFSECHRYINSKYMKLNRTSIMNRFF